MRLFIVKSEDLCRADQVESSAVRLKCKGSMPFLQVTHMGERVRMSSVGKRANSVSTPDTLGQWNS